MSCKCTDMDNDPIQMGLGPSHQMTEEDIRLYKLAEKIGDKWRDLARALKFSEADIDSIQKDPLFGSTKECCIAVLVRWMRREGRDATVKKLATALTEVELKIVTDKLMPMATTQNDIFNNTISKMETHCNCNCRHLEVLKEEGSKMQHTMKELEEKLSTAREKCEKFERDNATLRTTLSELERGLAIQRPQEQDNKEQGLRNCVDTAAQLEDVSGVTRNDLDTDQVARERQIGIQLKNLNEKLKKEVTSLLQVPEIKEDKLKTAVKLDLLRRLSESLQDMYSDIQAMVAETCKCNEDLKREFYDFAYHGLRAEHNDLVLRVKDLESWQAEMSDEEKKALQRLQQYQINRQRQIDKLEKRGLFSSPESLPETSSSYPTGGNSNSKKALGRNHTDPGVRQKQKKSREGATSAGIPPMSDEEKAEVCVTTIKKRSTLKSIFGRSKESKGNTCYPVSYRHHRDS